MTRASIQTWQPVPEEYMHRGERIAIAVASPGPGIVGVIACDDTDMTCGFNLAPGDARGVAALLDLAARPRAMPRPLRPSQVTSRPAMSRDRTASANWRDAPGRLP